MIENNVKRELSKSESFENAAEMFKQLSDPTRIKIFWLLSHSKECVINIAAALDMSSPAVSHHLKCLMDSGLIESKREGKEVYYTAADSVKIEELHRMMDEMLEISCPMHASENEASVEAIVKRAHDELISDVSRKITIEELARKYSINTTTLKSAFKKVYGDGIAAHLHKHRMEEAARRLVNTNDDIAGVARSVGYESQSKFSAAFKEVYGVSPSEYRK